MSQPDPTEFKFAGLPRWVPLAVAVFSVLLVVAGITWMFAFVATTLTEANEPVNPEGLEARYETINSQALERIAPRLSPPEAGE